MHFQMISDKGKTVDSGVIKRRATNGHELIDLGFRIERISDYSSIGK